MPNPYKKIPRIEKTTTIKNFERYRFQMFPADLFTDLDRFV